MTTRRRFASAAFLSIVVIGVSYFGLAMRSKGAPGPGHRSIARSPDEGGRRQATALGGEDERNESIKGPDQERWYFEKWHQKYGAVLPPDVMSDIWSQIHRLPSDAGGRSVNSWTALGPFGMRSVFNNGTYYSGRVLDLSYTDGWFLTGSASGGLWEPFLQFRFPLSDAVTSLAIGAFAAKPGTNASTILLGTGEPYQRGGTGLWETTDSGTSWWNVNMQPYSPSAFYTIRFMPNDPTMVFAASNYGCYRSTDGGLSWNMVLSGNCSDVAPSNPQDRVVYAALWGDGLYRSPDDGVTWSKMTTGGIPTTNVGRTALSVAYNPNYLYVSMARNDTNGALGVFRTYDGGATWFNVSPPGDYLWGQGWYANCIAISALTISTVLVGGGDLWRTDNAGASWTEISDPDVHVDQHRIFWLDGNNVYAANDGGVCFSQDAGVTWYTSSNTYPITQYVNFDVGVNNTGVIFGGSQDNGFSGTTDGGTTWNFTFGGDGGGISVDPSSANRIWGTLGVYGGDWAFRRHRSTDTGQTWDNTINTGIDPSGQWFTKIRNDRVPPVYLYTNSGPYVYRSVDYGTTWSAYNSPAFPASLYNLNISLYSAGYSVIYASLSPDWPYAGRQLRVFDSGAWYERSTGLPNDVWVRGVAPHPTDVNKAYALMTGFDQGQKVFKTTDRGVTWTNISGDLPNVPMGDLVPHPTDDNILYLGTEFGCYRTTNGGVNWARWNNGMPEANIVTEMGAIDRRNVDGTYYVLAATYGRGIWSREISGDDPAAVGIAGWKTPDGYSLMNYPNPFRGNTTIAFSVPRPEAVDLRVYDVTGRTVATLFKGPAAAGPHSVAFQGAGLPAGTYFYELKAGDITKKGKMVRVP